tara:strand:+ start:97707 stop:97871 length:165 start_codon:yes stop_codon:yes gene_type:complete
MAKSDETDSGQERRGQMDPDEQKRKKQAEAGAIEIDVHEEKVPDKVVKIREENS